ncbi:aminodeoxychorismate/anthranilate synthase component II [Putridiphycobacter roseus]|uniref:Aminodeoxychorismate/anthranilate synthase component II n=1 Tax=Putridiphycobacter roseus TaxID=2219161 RepID=A0A2W1MYM0_9FLAO|nr:aminodeoxychorismate/anthranilate synthase component II [Putridiphycobacter roseus]PZE15651.1 aminodeoxychorismate/anthranilate synthase component II [Putridiphycobacter roseus]
MKVLIIDNYDSFTYNLVYIIRQVTEGLSIYRNDKISPKECLSYDAIILSPGPGIPKDAGNLTAIIQTCAGRVPILGVCLGHQAIAEYLGGSLNLLEKVYHGVQSKVSLNGDSHKLFSSMPTEFKAGRYHSWAITPTESSDFETTAKTEEGTVMALQNLKQNLYGIQFHPESILTPEGELIIQNFLSICKNLKQ